MADYRQSQQEETYKILIIGNGSVGKSSLLKRYIDDQFDYNVKETVGLDFRAKKQNFDGQDVKIQIWDTAGQEKYKSITQSFYKGSDGILLAFDISSQETFDQLSRWLGDIDKNVGGECAKIIVANKKDLQPCINENNLKEFANKYQVKHFYTSALTGENVQAAFNELAQQIHLNKKKKKQQLLQNIAQEENPADKFSIKNPRVNGDKSQEQDKKKKGCC